MMYTFASFAPVSQTRRAVAGRIRMCAFPLPDFDHVIPPRRCDGYAATFGVVPYTD